MHKNYASHAWLQFILLKSLLHAGAYYSTQFFKMHEEIHSKKNPDCNKSGPGREKSGILYEDRPYYPLGCRLALHPVVAGRHLYDMFSGLFYRLGVDLWMNQCVRYI